MIDNKNKISIIIIAFVLVITLICVTITLAWFTRSKQDDNFNLDYADIEINVDDGQDNKKVDVKILDAENNEYSLLMPGDKVKLTVRVTNVGNAECYYILNFKSDNNILLLNNFYYFNEEVKVYSENIKELGVLKVGESHILTLYSNIDNSFSLQGFKENYEVNAYAIQKQNLTEEKAFEELSKTFNFS